MPSEKQIQKALWILMLASLAVRAFLAGFIELGNDEVYYWTYAKFPDLSHFDHPPMVGWIIQFFTLNLTFQHEFFIRLGAVIFGTAGTYIIYLIGKELKDPLTGLYAAFLYTSSFYCFIISGTFIMPDTPQGFFWLASLLLLIRVLPDKDVSVKSRRGILLAGVVVGLALLSKYHSVFLILGAFLYILFFNRAWFRAKETYMALGIVLLFSLPILIWNARNDFISFTFHESRVGGSASVIRWDFFTRELVGQIFYNNPVNFILILTALVSVVSGRKFLGQEKLFMMLFFSVPLAGTFLFFSLFDSTLPHWTGPAYTGFILIAASFLSDVFGKGNRIWVLPWPAGIALALTIVLIILAAGQIRYGWIPFDRLRTGDFSAQLYGWRQLGEKFPEILNKDVESGAMPADAPVITHRWFPAAHIDYYVTSPAGRKVYALGTLERIHKYYWIDRERGNIPQRSSAYFLAFSDEMHPPTDIYGRLFDTIYPTDTIRILRCGKTVRDVYVFRMQGLKKEIRFDKITDFAEPPAERIRFWVNEIMTHPEWLEEVRQKAKQYGRTEVDQVWQEAKWIAEREMQGRN